MSFHAIANNREAPYKSRREKGLGLSTVKGVVMEPVGNDMPMMRCQ